MTVRTINFDAMRLRWQRHIIRWGNGATFILRRSATPDLPVIAAVIAYSPKERQGAPINPEDEKAIISALAPDGSLLSREPDRERDTLIALDPADGETVLYRYRMTAKPQREASTNAKDTVLWTVSVRK
jgi:hypothetical protein